MGVALNFTVDISLRSVPDGSLTSSHNAFPDPESVILFGLDTPLNTPLKIYILPALRRQTIESDVHFPCVLSVLCRGSQHSQSPFTVIHTSLRFHNDSSNVFGTDNQSTDNQSAFAVDICHSHCDTTCVETNTSVIIVII